MRARNARRTVLDGCVAVTVNELSIASLDITCGRARPCHAYDVIVMNASDVKSMVFNALIIYPSRFAVNDYKYDGN